MIVSLLQRNAHEGIRKEMGLPFLPVDGDGPAIVGGDGQKEAFSLVRFHIGRHMAVLQRPGLRLRFLHLSGDLFQGVQIQVIELGVQSVQGPLGRNDDPGLGLFGPADLPLAQEGLRRLQVCFQIGILVIDLGLEGDAGLFSLGRNVEDSGGEPHGIVGVVLVFHRQPGLQGKDPLEIAVDRRALRNAGKVIGDGQGVLPLCFKGYGVEQGHGFARKVAVDLVDVFKGVKEFRDRDFVIVQLPLLLRHFPGRSALFRLLPDHGQGHGVGIDIDLPVFCRRQLLGFFQALNGIFGNDIFHAQEGIRRQDGGIHDAHAVVQVPVSQIVQKEQGLQMGIGGIARNGPGVGGQDVIVGGHDVVVGLLPAPGLGDPVVGLVSLLDGPDLVCQGIHKGIVGLHLFIAVIVHLDLGVIGQLPGRKDQDQEACQDPHGPAAFQTKEAVEGRDDKEGKDGRHIQHLEVRPALYILGQGKEQEKAGRGPEKEAGGLIVLSCPVQKEGGKEKDHEAPQEGVAVPVAVRSFEQGKDRGQGSPVKGLEHEENKAGGQELVAGPDLFRKEEDNGPQKSQTPAEKDHLAQGAGRPHGKALDQADKVAEIDVLEKDRIRISRRPVQVEPDRGIKDHGAQKDANGHGPYIFQGPCDQAHGPDLPVRQGQQGFKGEPEDGKKTVQTGDVPVEEDGQAHRNGQGRRPALLQDPVDPQHDQGQHIDPVQPHDIAGLHEVIVHPGVGKGQGGGIDPVEPAAESPLQVPGHGSRGQSQLEGGGDVKEIMEMGPVKEDQQKIDGGTEIVAEDDIVVLAQKAGHGIKNTVPARPAFLEIGEKLDVLNVGVAGSKAHAAEGGIVKGLEEKNDGCKGHGDHQQGKHKSAEPGPLLHSIAHISCPHEDPPSQPRRIRLHPRFRRRSCRGPLPSARSLSGARR